MSAFKVDKDGMKLVSTQELSNKIKGKIDLYEILRFSSKLALTERRVLLAQNSVCSSKIPQGFPA